MRALSVFVPALGLTMAFVFLWPLFAQASKPPDRIEGGFAEDPVLGRAWDAAGRPMAYRNWGKPVPAAPPGRRARRVTLAITSWNKPRAELPHGVVGRVRVEGRHASGSPTRHWVVIAEVEVPSTQRRLTVRVPSLGAQDVLLDPVPERPGRPRVVDLPERDLSLAAESRGAWRATKLPRGWRFSGDPARAPLVVGEVESGTHRLVQRVGGPWSVMQLYIVPRRDGARISVRRPYEFANDIVRLRIFGKDGRDIRPRRIQAHPLGWTAFVPVPRERVGGVELTRRRVRWRRIL